jgi:predicted Co/Zn/Cd cation transporter (cation efflux family)
MPDRSSASGSAREQRLLVQSMVLGGTFGVVGVVWGLAAGSQIILFDGVYASLAILLSWLSLRASQLVAAGATVRYPYGREALAPLVIAVQGMALLGTCLYAIVTSVQSILEGGSEVDAGSAALYGLITTLGALAVWFHLRRYAAQSELVGAETAQWAAGWLLSLGMLVAFGAVLLLEGTSYDAIARYVDPVLVLVVCVAFLPAPFRMVRTTVVELLEGAPPSHVQAPVRAVVDEVTEEFGLAEPVVRMSKLGTKLYLEVDYLVEAGRWDVSDADRVRHALRDRLTRLPYTVWLNVDLSTDPTWSA